MNASSHSSYHVINLENFFPSQFVENSLSKNSLPVLLVEINGNWISCSQLAASKSILNSIIRSDLVLSLYFGGWITWEVIFRDYRRIKKAEDYRNIFHYDVSRKKEVLNTVQLLGTLFSSPYLMTMINDSITK